MPLLKMTDKRQMVKSFRHHTCCMHIMTTLIQELTNPDQKKRLLAALSHMKKYLPTFTAAMQNYVKSPSAASKVLLLFRGSFKGEANSLELELATRIWANTPPMKPYHP